MFTVMHQTNATTDCTTLPTFLSGYLCPRTAVRTVLLFRHVLHHNVHDSYSIRHEQAKSTTLHTISLSGQYNCKETGNLTRCDPHFNTLAIYHDHGAKSTDTAEKRAYPQKKMGRFRNTFRVFGMTENECTFH